MSTRLHEARAGRAAVNGTKIYQEVRGNGPSVLFISGATGDAGHFAQVADLLADEFTVVTYDRRGNSRSPRPAGWTATSIDEQADDAAALVEALGLAPIAAFGTSGGGAILLNLILRHPEVLRGTIVHEPPLVPVVSNADELMAGLQSMMEDEMARGGPRGAMESFIRWAAGDAAFDGLDPELRERMLGNAEVFFGVEMEAFASYLPAPEALAGVKLPVVVSAGEENRDASSSGHYLYEASDWLAKVRGAELEEVPGAHAPYFTQPKEFAETLRPILRNLS